MSMTLDMLAGIASYVGRSTTGAAAVGAGSEAAIAAAIEVAIVVGHFCGWIKVWSLNFRPRRGISIDSSFKGVLPVLLSIFAPCLRLWNARVNE